MTEPAKPLPCPFCGNEGKAVTDSSGHWHWVICSSDPKDAMLIGCYDTESEAIARWNTRAADPRLAELRAIADRLAHKCSVYISDESFDACESFTQWKEKNPE